MKAPAEQYSTAHTISIVQDNLQTQNARSFYEHLDAGEAFQLEDRN